MNKFKSAHVGHSHQELIIVGLNDGVRVSVEHGSLGVKGIIIAPSDAPALALAILEAAGVADRRHWNQDVEDGTDVHLEFIAKHLADYIKAQDRAAAEAEDKAKLEAEALELWNVVRESQGRGKAENWIGIPDRVKERWLAVAHRARELAKEATK